MCLLQFLTIKHNRNGLTPSAVTAIVTESKHNYELSRSCCTVPDEAVLSNYKQHSQTSFGLAFNIHIENHCRVIITALYDVHYLMNNCVQKYNKGLI